MCSVLNVLLHQLSVLKYILPAKKRHMRTVQISVRIGQIVPCRVISLMLMALRCLLARTGQIVYRRQCLGVNGSISSTRSRGRGPLLNSMARGTTVDQRSEWEQKKGFSSICMNNFGWKYMHLSVNLFINTVRISPLLKTLTLCCNPLAWQVSFLPGSSLIIARFWFQWHQFTSSTLI